MDLKTSTVRPAVNQPIQIMQVPEPAAVVVVVQARTWQGPIPARLAMVGKAAVAPAVPVAVLCSPPQPLVPEPAAVAATAIW